MLLVTAFDLDHCVYQALKAGISGFLLEDEPPETLAAAVRTVAAGDALLAPGHGMSARIRLLALGSCPAWQLRWPLPGPECRVTGQVPSTRGVILPVRWADAAMMHYRRRLLCPANGGWVSLGRRECATAKSARP